MGCAKAFFNAAAILEVRWGGLPECTSSQVVIMSGGHGRYACHAHPAGRRVIAGCETGEEGCVGGEDEG